MMKSRILTYDDIQQGIRQMNETDRILLGGAVSLLKRMTVASGDLRIEAESSFDEAVILGTRLAYLRAGLAFLEMAGMEEGVNAEVKHLFSEEGAVWPVSGYILENEQAVADKASEFS